RGTAPGTGSASAIMIIASVLPVSGIPGVRQAHSVADSLQLFRARGHRHLLPGEHPPVGQPIDHSGAREAGAHVVSSDRTGSRLLCVTVTAPSRDMVEIIQREQNQACV